MIVEIRGANFRNKGAELMLRAVVQEVVEQGHIPATSTVTGTYDERSRLGLWQKLDSERITPEWSNRFATLLPDRIKRRTLGQYGLVFETGMGAVLDASGFAYSDQFDLRRSQIAAERFSRAKAAGQSVVLLPQAFGPFLEPRIRETVIGFVNRCDRVYAREQVSYKYLVEAGASDEVVQLAPDFTCLLEAVGHDGDEARDSVLIVPSAKLLSETTAEVRSAYVPFLAHIANALLADGVPVCFLQHERDDGATIELVQALVQPPLPVIFHEDPLVLKSVISSARGVIGSRFHALVSALSQGVPAIGIGWSHKYEMLFKDYGCAEYVLDPVNSANNLDQCLESIVGPSRTSLVETLQRAAADERVRARQMWAEVHALLR